MKIPWVILTFLHITISQPSSRCIYGEECWPKESDFFHLASQLSQPLLHPKPPGSACYPINNPSGKCSEAIENAHNGRWRSGQPGSMQAPFLETFTFPNGTVSACYINATLGFPCSQGSIPEIGVDARSVQDVQATVRFASKHNLRLVVKNTGAFFLATTTSGGARVVEAFYFECTTLRTSPIVHPSPLQKLLGLTVSAGVQWYEAYDAAEAQGRTIVGASGVTVGAAGGWVMGNGNGDLSPRHGLGVDNIVEFEVVTANGTNLIVNTYKNADLFWALRGGGGGTYAVVLSATHITHDLVPLTAIGGFANFTSPNIAKSVITEFIRIHPSLADSGWGGSSFFSQGLLSYLFAAPNVTVTEANTILEPFLAFTRNTTGQEVRNDVIPYNSYYAWFSASFSRDGDTGHNTELGSRLLPRDLSEQDPGKVADILLALPAT
ncbi:hypothetical protein BDZ94DRAFT_1313486 [Collybia nuda]|uniref:FAD-binding PCMH-type domain-containing protein n=1 Tax=Collybia nuda TaxID=64659 RepID=A0A9P5XX86_9AGAR|nr:hypothetical protein BDZ94DRAFT_1313486 [Collybia nuda]